MTLKTSKNIEVYKRTLTQPKLAELVRTLVEGIKRRTFRVEELFAGVNPQLGAP